MRLLIVSLSLTVLVGSIAWGGGHKKSRRHPLRPTCEAGPTSQTQPASSPPKREQIGEVFGKPVFRDEVLKPNQKIPDSETLHHRFLIPLAEKYQREHEKELAPTPQEIEAMVTFCRKKDPDRENDDLLSPEDTGELEKERNRIENALKDDKLATERRSELESEKAIADAAFEMLNTPHWIERTLVEHWKFERHLYDNYGGGRILWQQLGLEAFDAMHNWLKSQEEQGHFKITDPYLHKAFYRYWRDQHHDFMIEAEGDEELLQSGFLEPEWLREFNHKNSQLTP